MKLVPLLRSRPCETSTKAIQDASFSQCSDCISDAYTWSEMNWPNRTGILSVVRSQHDAIKNESETYIECSRSASVVVGVEGQRCYVYLAPSLSQTEALKEKSKEKRRVQSTIGFTLLWVPKEADFLQPLELVEEMLNEHSVSCGQMMKVSVDPP